MVYIVCKEVIYIEWYCKNKIWNITTNYKNSIKI